MDYQALKTALLNETDQELVGHRNAGNTGAMADWCNAETDTMIWKPRVTITELLSAVVWTEFIALTQDKRDAWFALTQGGSEGVDATVERVRDGFGAIFGVSDTLDNLAAAAVRKATRYEAAYTDSSGVCSEFGVRVTNDDIVRALES